MLQGIVFDRSSYRLRTPSSPCCNVMYIILYTYMYMQVHLALRTVCNNNNNIRLRVHGNRVHSMMFFRTVKDYRSAMWKPRRDGREIIKQYFIYL